jgi:CBS domain-containing protein
MNVAAILREKGSHVVTVRETLSLEEAAAVLDSNAIGALVVIDPHGRPTAVLGERDVVRELALNGAAALARPIAHTLTQAFVTASLEDTLAEVMVRMTERRARHLPVIDKGKLVGIVSIGDVVRFKIADIEAETAAIREYILS